jgi:hypothetical protein
LETKFETLDKGEMVRNGNARTRQKLEVEVSIKLVLIHSKEPEWNNTNVPITLLDNQKKYHSLILVVFRLPSKQREGHDTLKSPHIDEHRDVSSERSSGALSTTVKIRSELEEALYSSESCSLVLDDHDTIWLIHHLGIGPTKTGSPTSVLHAIGCGRRKKRPDL